MHRTISATEARIHFGELMRSVVEKGETVVVERAGKPQVVMLSIAQYEHCIGEDVGKPNWRDLVRQSRALMERTLAGREMPDIDEIIHEMREDRDAQILNSLR